MSHLLLVPIHVDALHLKFGTGVFCGYSVVTQINAFSH